MKVFIVSDMEGVAGIVKWQQTDGTKEKRAYHEGRELYTAEINAAVRGARTGGATEIVVMDCHGAGEEWTFNSLIPDKLDRRLRVRGSEKTGPSTVMSRDATPPFVVCTPRPGRRGLTTRSRASLARVEVQRRLRGRDRDQRSSDSGCPVLLSRATRKVPRGRNCSDRG
jgi:hypothetical protein